MRTSIVMLVLVLAVSAVAQSTPPQTQQPPAGTTAGAPAGQAAAPAGQAGQPAAPQQQKTIKDPAEYNAYLNAIQQSAPNAKSVALEGFIQQYPNSVVKEDALEQLMAAYSQLGNLQKVLDTANRLLQANPNNLRGLAALTALKLQAAQQGGPQAQQNFNEAAQFAQKGLQVLNSGQKPESITAEELPKLQQLFAGTAGMAAVQSKNYPEAQQLLSTAVKGEPNNIAYVYNLALAYLQAQPPDFLNGLWYIARAVALSPSPQGKQEIARYGRSQYVKYHGSVQGWDQLLQTAASNPLPPAGFAIAPKPSPAELASQLVQNTPIGNMSFDDFQTIFTSGNAQAIETVWNQIKDKPIAFEAKVVEASPTKLALSASGEDISNNVADVSVTTVAAIPAKDIPKVGSMAKIQATPVSYTVQPYMITMTKGMLIAEKQAAPAKAPAKKAPVRRRP